MDEKNNTFSDKDVGVDYDGETLREFKLVHGVEELQMEQKMTYEEAYAYYQALRRGVDDGNGNAERNELVSEKLEKIAGELEGKLRGLGILKKYTTKVEAGSYIDNGDFVDIRYVRGELEPFPNRFRLVDGKFINESLVWRGGVPGSKTYGSIDEIVADVEKHFLEHESRQNQKELEKAVASVMSDPEIGSKLRISFPSPGHVDFNIKDVFREKYGLEKSLFRSFYLKIYEDGSMKAETWPTTYDKAYALVEEDNEFNMEGPEEWKNFTVWMKGLLGKNLKALEGGSKN